MVSSKWAPKRLQNCSAWARSAKEKTRMSRASWRNDCVRAERQSFAFAKAVGRTVVVVRAALGWQHRWCGHSGLIVVLPSSPLRRTGGDGPAATDRWRWNGGALWVVAAHARRYLDVNGGRTRIHGAAGGVERDLAEFEQKGNIISAWRWKFIVFQ